MAQIPMNLTAEARTLRLAEPFRIATKTYQSAENVFVWLSFGEHQGIGEVSPEDRKGESVEGVLEQLRGLDLAPMKGPFDLEAIGEMLPAGAARCALDIAAHDLAARVAGVSVAQLLGVEGRQPPPTSVTVPISDVAAMVERARSFTDHPFVKVKVGFAGDVDAIAALRAVYPGQIRIDANEGWVPEQAIERLSQMERFDIELCEQPIPAGMHDELRRVTASTSIRVFADEDVSTARDVAQLAGVVDGVNLKLRKTGGIREAVKAIATARALEMGVMLGCDLESGVAATAQACVSTLVDHCDIDGPLLLAEDPYPGVRYDRSHVTLPSGPGLGVKAFP